MFNVLIWCNLNKNLIQQDLQTLDLCNKNFQGSILPMLDATSLQNVRYAFILSESACTSENLNITEKVK